MVPGFHEWFMQYKAEELATSMTQSVCESAGLGNPPYPFCTNDIESINRLIKCKVKYKAAEWPDFCRLAKEIVHEQQSEVEKAVINISEYRFKPEYRHLEVPVHKWNTVTEQQRQWRLSKLHQTLVRKIQVAESQAAQPDLTDVQGGSEFGAAVLTIQGETFAAQWCNLPRNVLNGIFSKV